MDATNLGRLVLAALLVFAPGVVAQEDEPAAPRGITHVRMRSNLLSDFFGREIFMDAGVVVPPDRKPGEKLPLCVSIHGLGGSYRKAWSEGARLVEWMKTGQYPRMIFLYPDANGPFGHHVFADSVNNGPRGRALVEELVPKVERDFGATGAPRGRFLTGHSSGGWSSLWLLVNHADHFGGAWATAPDSVDFRDMNGIDLYSYENAFVDGEGREIPFLRQGDRFVMTVRQTLQRAETEKMLVGTESVFSPRGDDGRPMKLFDRRTGAIDREVVRAWARYDIAARLRREWKTLGPKLSRKINVYVGTLDTYRLEGAVRLLAADLEALGSEARVVLVEGRDHSDLFREHSEHWPRGMLTRIHEEMVGRFAEPAPR